MSTFTGPDIERCTPISVTADSPVLNVLEPVAESSLSYAFGNPIYSVIISDEDIGSPLVNTPDILIAFNAPSFDKFEPKVVAGGAVFSDSTLISKKSERSDISAYTIPATELANEMNAPKLANVIMLGYVIAKTNIFDFDYFAEKLTASVPESKAELRELNKKALLLGYNYAE